MPIGRFSQACRLTVKALRLYDELGLLSPARVDPDSGYRYYRMTQAGRAEVIRLLRSLDMPLEGIAAFLAEKDPARALARLERHEERLRETIARYHEALATLQRYIERKEETVQYQVTLRELQPVTLAATRCQTTQERIGSVFPQALDRVFGVIGPSGVAPVGPPVAVYHRFDEEQVDMEVGVPVAAGIPRDSDPTSEVHTTVLPGGRSAWTQHIGPYDRLHEAWAALTVWVQESGLESSGPCWESYATDPSEGADPAEYVTDLFWPVA